MRRSSVITKAKRFLHCVRYTRTVNHSHTLWNASSQKCYDNSNQLKVFEKKNYFNNNKEGDNLPMTSRVPNEKRKEGILANGKIPIASLKCRSMEHKRQVEMEASIKHFYCSIHHSK